MDGHWRPHGGHRPTEHLRTALRATRSTGERGAGVLERASIIGRVFWPVAVVALAEGSASGPRTDPGLQRKQLIEPTTSWFDDEPAYKFLHILIRDETYSGILKRRRADLHERFADWMLAPAGIRIDEQREIIGYHLEQSAVYRRELGPLDERGQGLAWRAPSSSPGWPPGLQSWRHARRWQPPSASRRHPASRRSGTWRSPSRCWRSAERRRTVRRGRSGARRIPSPRPRRIGDRSLETTASIVRLHLHFASEGGDASAVRAQTEEAIAILEAAGDDAGLARAWRLMNLIGLTVGRLAEAERAAVNSIEHAKRTGDDVMVRRNVGVLATRSSSARVPSIAASNWPTSFSRARVMTLDRRAWSSAPWRSSTR